MPLSRPDANSRPFDPKADVNTEISNVNDIALGYCMQEALETSCNNNLLKRLSWLACVTV